MRVLVISDIHANRAALEAVLDDAEQFRYEAVWCLGDLVGYGPEPDWCITRVRLLRERCPLTALVGNHDWAVLEKMEVDDFNPEARRTVLWTRRHVSPENLAWLSDLPVNPIVEQGMFTLAHGSPRDSIWEYILDPFTALDNFRSDALRTPFCLVGHTHVPMIYALAEGEPVVRVRSPAHNAAVQIGGAGSGRAILNPGSVGQPRDGDPRAAYAILDTERLTWLPRRVPYAIEITQAHMRDAGLPERLITRLSFGW